MASVFKRGGKKAKGAWIASWFDHNGKRQTKSTRTTDKATAERIAKKNEADAALRREGVVDTTQERFANEAGRLIAEHVADFRAALLARPNTDKHVELTIARVRFIIEECGATHTKHLTLSVVQQAIKAKRDVGRSLETCNSYLRAIKGFTRWTWRDKRTPDDALATLESYNASMDRRHPRREFTSDELVFLLSFVEGYTQRAHNLPGPDRAQVYRVALGTGFRANELRSLVPASFDLCSDPPTVTVNAAYSKRRRNDVQPIRRDLAELLRPWLSGRERDAPLFANLPGSPARMLRKDLAAARKQWIAEASTDAERTQREDSDFLVYRDANGLFADFHATRHTYISGIVAGGASVKTAQELARHSDPRLTIGRYSHARLHDLQGALEALPDLRPRKPDQEALRATGTETGAPDGAQRMAQHTGREKVRDGAIACDQEVQQPSESEEVDVHPNVLSIANISESVRPGASNNEKRRARDSNPQPREGHLISSEAASQFAYPP